jgi:hypothetical protein
MSSEERAACFVQVCREHGIRLGSNRHPTWLRRLWRVDPMRAYLAAIQSDEIAVEWLLWSCEDEIRRGVALDVDG